MFIAIITKVAFLKVYWKGFLIIEDIMQPQNIALLFYKIANC